MNLIKEMITKQEKSHVDLVVAWPRSIDYPLFRQFVTQHREFFGKVIIVFTETNQGVDERELIQGFMAKDDITFIDSRKIVAGEDWRDVAVNMALDVSDASWVWFMEQDLFVTSQAFWPLIAKTMIHHDAIGWMDGATRLHPACLLVKREFINKTPRFFGIVENKLDHFAKFFTSLRLSGAKICKLKYPNDLFYHMNGLSHNMTLLERGEEVTYQPDEFRQYLALCSKAEYYTPNFRKLMDKGLEGYKVE